MTLKQRRCLAWIVGAGTVGATVLLMARGLAGDKAPPNEVNPADFSKFRIEKRTKNVLAERTVPSPAASASAFVNPKVEPGKVHWHPTFADACAVAKASGKPVLLFQMMGRLDERFC